MEKARYIEKSPVLIIDRVTVAEIDEALGYLNDRLKVDRYGARMTHQRRLILQGAIDDLLDERLALTRKGAERGL